MIYKKSPQLHTPHFFKLPLSKTVSEFQSYLILFFWFLQSFREKFVHIFWFEITFGWKSDKSNLIENYGFMGAYFGFFVGAFYNNTKALVFWFLSLWSLWARVITLLSLVGNIVRFLCFELNDLSSSFLIVLINALPWSTRVHRQCRWLHWRVRRRVAARTRSRTRSSKFRMMKLPMMKLLMDLTSRLRRTCVVGQ